MIVTTSDEIRAYVPTSVYAGDDSLLSLIEDTEESVLLPVLGQSLYEKMCQEYNAAVEKYGGVTPQCVRPEDVTPEIRLVRLCQMPVVYLTLANSTGLLGISLNDGGGLNQATTEGYDKADRESVARFERDAYFKGHRGIDRLLVFLERDAQAEKPVFSELWKESSYFYEQGGLLFSTAVTFNRYLDIGGSREKFIALLPDIRYCQGAYIEPAFGERLVDAWINWACGPADVRPDAGKEGVWREAIDRIRMALALYVESRRPERQRRYSENEAAYSLARARSYVEAHCSDFSPYSDGSPLCPKKEPVESVEDQQKPAFDYDDPSNAIFVFRPFSAGRH